MHLLLQINITRNYKLNTSIIYTKVTNSDDISTLFKKFHNDDIKILRKFLNAKNFL